MHKINSIKVSLKASRIATTTIFTCIVETPAYPEIPRISLREVIWDLNKLEILKRIKVQNNIYYLDITGYSNTFFNTPT